MNIHLQSITFFAFISLIFQSDNLLGSDSMATRTRLLARDGRSLEDCFKSALKRSEIVATQGELIQQAEEKIVQAKAAMLPTLNAVASYLRQTDTSSSAISSTSPASQNTIKVTLDQPLFRGFREFAALRQQKLSRESQKIAREQAELQLYKDVTQAFYAVIANEKDFLNLEEEITVNQKRLKELKEFERVGRSRVTDVLSTETNIATLEAQEEALWGQIEVSRQAFAFQTGLDPAVPLQDSVDVTPEHVPALRELLEKLEHRPDVETAKQTLAAAEEGIPIAKGGHLPTVDLLGDYYFVRPGTLSNVNWDIQLALSVPLFAGGAIDSQIRQASSIVKQSELALSQIRRQAEEEIRTVHGQVISDLDQIKKYDRAYQLAKQTYQQELKDYRLGTVTNIEVLQILTSTQETHRLLDRSKFTTKSDWIHLQLATGTSTLLK